MYSISEMFTISTMLLYLFLVALPPLAIARIDFECVFGDIVSTVDDKGKPVSFCPTKMDPPFMKAGDFIWAYHKDRCFECVCEDGLGLACCDCPRKRGG